MTEKRYSDGTLAKWYYSQTNVISDGDNEYYLRNKESVKDLDYNELLGTNDLLDELNRLSDENEKLKKDLNSLSHNWALMYDEAKNKVEELSKENKQLKGEIKDLKFENEKKYRKIKQLEQMLQDVER